MLRNFFFTGIVVCILGVSAAFAQAWRFGLKTGVPLTPYFETGSLYSSATRRYTVGVSAEWDFNSRIGLELDALYKRMGYAGQSTSPFHPFFGIITTSTFDVVGNSWEFPFLVKYRFDRRLGPYFGVGGVLRYITTVRARGQTVVQDLIADTTITTPLDTSNPFDLRKRLWPGLAFATGLELGRDRLRVQPELRYTRWTANISNPCCGQLRLNQNQVELLVGLTF